MKRLSIVVGLLGLLHLSFFAWASWIAKWQNTNLMRRFNTMDSLDIAMEVFYERMHTPFMVSAALGISMLIAAYMLYRSLPAGWTVWLASLAFGFAAAILAIFQAGPSGGNLLRLIFLAIIAYAAHSIKKKAGSPEFPQHESKSKSVA